jgi:hypothetical protein
LEKDKPIIYIGFEYISKGDNKMILQRLSYGTFAGLFSGVFLGLFLKVIEQLTNLKVYTLLLNVDYIPILNTMSLTEAMEFMLHLFISVLLSIILVFFLNSKDTWSPNRKQFFVLFISIGIGLLLYPTTALSSRTPAWNDFMALFYWSLAHAIYGWLLGAFFRKRSI